MEMSYRYVMGLSYGYRLGSYPITFSLEPLGGFVFCKTGSCVL